MNVYNFLLMFTAFLLPLWRTGAHIISGVTVIAGAAYWLKKNEQIREIPKKFKLATMFYLICMVISILFSPSYKIGFYYLLVEFTVILFLPFVLWPLLNERVAHLVMRMLALGLLISSFIVIYQGYGSAVNIRPNGFIGHMNYAGAAAILVPAILAYLHGNAHADKKITIIGCIVVAVAIIGSVYNGTRAIFVDLGVVGIFYALLFWKPTLKQGIALGLAAGILILTVGTIKSGERIKDFNPKTMSIVTRLQMWEIGVETWKNNPLLGVGVGQCPNIEFVEDSSGHWHTNLRAKKAWNDRAHLHNLVIQTLTETGLVGLAGLLVYWGTILSVFLKNALKKRNVFARAAFCAVLGFLCHNMTDYAYGITTEAILISLLTTLAISQIDNEKNFR